MVSRATRSQIVEWVQEEVKASRELNEKHPVRLAGLDDCVVSITLRSTAHLAGTRVTFGWWRFPSGRRIGEHQRRRVEVGVAQAFGSDPRFVSFRHDCVNRCESGEALCGTGLVGVHRQVLLG